MYTKQMTTAFLKKRVIIIIAFIMTFLTLSIKANADSAYINQADYPILKEDSSAYKSLMEHNEKSKNGHIYFYSVKSTGNLSMDDYRKNKFKELNLKSNDMLITYALNDGNRNVGITTGSQVRKYLSDDDAINVLRENSDSLKSNNPDELSKGLFTILSKYETYQDQQGTMSKSEKAAYDRETQREIALLHKLFYTIIVVVIIVVSVNTVRHFANKNKTKKRKELDDAAIGAIEDYYKVKNHFLTQEDFKISNGYYISNKIEQKLSQDIYDSLPKTKKELEEVEFFCQFNNYNLLTYLKEERYQKNQWLSMKKFADMVRMENLYKNNEIPDKLLKSQNIKDVHDLLRKIYEASQSNEQFALSLPVKEPGSKELYSKEILNYLYDSMEQKDLATLSKNKLREKYGKQSEYSDASIFTKYTHTNHDYYNPNTDSLITMALYNALAEESYNSSYNSYSSSPYADNSYSSSSYNDNSSYDTGSYSSYDSGSSSFGGGDMGGGSI